MKNLELLCESTVEALKSRGAELAYCSATVSETREFNVDGGEFSLMRTLFDNSLTMTAILGGKKGSVGSNSFEDEAVRRAISDCINSAEASNPDDAWALCDTPYDRTFKMGAFEPDLDKLFMRSKELLETIKRDYPLIVIEQMIISHDKGHTVYRNSVGTRFVKDSGEYNVDIMFSAHEGEVASSFFSSGVVCANLDTPFIEMGCIRKDLEDVQKQLHTVSSGEKFVGTMILTPGCFGDFLGSICSDFAGDSAILEGTSIWKDKLFKRVADERLTISFNPSDERIVCGQSYSSEGFLAEDFDFIRDGVLQTFLIGLYVANKTGFERAKNSCSGLIVKEGCDSLDDIIKNCENGIIVGRFSGGSPASNGDFSGVAKNSFLIKDGKIAGALTETMISGNIADMLNNLRGISKERVADGGGVVPYLAFDGITVSGKQ